MFQKPQHIYKVKAVNRIRNGFFVDLVLDLGFGVCSKMCIRLSDVMLPTINLTYEELEALAHQTTARLYHLSTLGDAYVKTTKEKVGHLDSYYGCLYVVVEYSGSVINVNDLLVEEGFAVRQSYSYSLTLV